jgi:hypothetical protein
VTRAVDRYIKLLTAGRPGRQLAVLILRPCCTEFCQAAQERRYRLTKAAGRRPSGCTENVGFSHTALPPPRSPGGCWRPLGLRGPRRPDWRRWGNVSRFFARNAGELLDLGPDHCARLTAVGRFIKLLTVGRPVPRAVTPGEAILTVCG